MHFYSKFLNIKQIDSKFLYRVFNHHFSLHLFFCLIIQYKKEYINIPVKSNDYFKKKETPVFYRCIPSYIVNAANAVADVTSTDSTTNTTYTMSNANGVLSSTTITNGIKYVYQLLNIKGFGIYSF